VTPSVTAAPENGRHHSSGQVGIELLPTGHFQTDMASQRRIEVDSSAIRSVGYQPDVGVLEIEFKGSGLYRYYGVPKAVYRRLLTAESIGGFVNTRIKPVYPHSKVTPR